MINFTKYKKLFATLFFITTLFVLAISKAYGEVVFHGGEEFQVNSHMDGLNYWSPIAVLANGDFVVTWHIRYVEGEADCDVYAQIFSPSATKRDNEFRVNINTAGDQSHPCIAALSNGNFVIVWHNGDVEDGSRYGVYAQIFDASGNRVDDYFQVNTYTDDDQYYPSVATLNDGNFVVVWASNGQDGSGYGIYAQIFKEDGTKFGSEFRVNTYTAGDQNRIFSVAALNNGNFVVAWPSEGQDGDSWGIYAQIFKASGDKFNDEFRVNTYTAGSQLNSFVAPFNDKFIVIWKSYGQDGSEYGAFAQIFNETGIKVGDEFQINTYTVDSQSPSAVAAISNENFLIVWTSDLQDGSGRGLYGQIFDELGAKVGEEFQINIYTTNDQHGPYIASFPDGSFIVTWASMGQDEGADGIFGRIFTPNMIPTIGDLTKVGTKNTALTFDKTDFTGLFEDADGHSMTKIKITSLPGGGSLKLLSSGAVIEGQEIDVDDIEYLVFDPNEGWPGTTSFGWQAFDGLDYSDVKAVNINIENRANGLAIEATSKKSVCGCDVSIPIDDTLNIVDTNDVSLRGAKVTMSRDVDLALDSLEFTDQDEITGFYDPTKGGLLLEGKSNVDNYQKALRSVK